MELQKVQGMRMLQNSLGTTLFRSNSVLGRVGCEIEIRGKCKTQPEAATSLWRHIPIRSSNVERRDKSK